MEIIAPFGYMGNNRARGRFVRRRKRTKKARLSGAVVGDVSPRADRRVAMAMPHRPHTVASQTASVASQSCLSHQKMASTRVPELFQNASPSSRPDAYGVASLVRWVASIASEIRSDAPFNQLICKNFFEQMPRPFSGSAFFS